MAILKFKLFMPKKIKKINQISTSSSSSDFKLGQMNKTYNATNPPKKKYIYMQVMDFSS